MMSYNQVLEYLEKAQQEDDPLYKFRAITNHHGPLKKGDPNYNSSLYNVNGRQRRSQKNLYPLLLKMILLHVQLLQSIITYDIHLNGTRLNI